MDLDWTRLGTALRAGRVARGMEQQDVAQAIGVKRGAVYNIETGKIKKVTKTIRDYAALVGWAPGSPERVLAGSEPVAADGAPPPSPIPKDEAGHGEAADLSVAVRTALREGPLLDSRVIRIRTPAGQVTTTIVARGVDGMTPEQLVEALRAWRDSDADLLDGRDEAAE